MQNGDEFVHEAANVTNDFIFSIDTEGWAATFPACVSGLRFCVVNEAPEAVD